MRLERRFSGAKWSSVTRSALSFINRLTGPGQQLQPLDITH